MTNNTNHSEETQKHSSCARTQINMRLANIMMHGDTMNNGSLVRLSYIFSMTTVERQLPGLHFHKSTLNFTDQNNRAAVLRWHIITTGNGWTEETAGFGCSIPSHVKHDGKNKCGGNP